MATCNNYQLRLNDFCVSHGEGQVTYQTYKTLYGRRKKLIAHHQLNLFQLLSHLLPLPGERD